MNAMTFDTLAAAKRIEAAGLDRATAEAVVTEIAAAQVELFSKADGIALQDSLLTTIGWRPPSASSVRTGAASRR